MSDRPRNVREVEDSIKTEFRDDMSYGDYLDLHRVLSAQHPRTDVHDEMLFIVIHQASELWLKLANYELAAAMREVADNNLRQAFKVMSRIKTIINQLTQSWDILSTLTPVDYLRFRDTLGNASGFQSYNYRKFEFLLGNKNEQVMRVFRDKPDVWQSLDRTLRAPSLYDIVLAELARSGIDVAPSVLGRDVTQPYEPDASVDAAWLTVYRQHQRYFDLYELGEKLVDIENAVQEWRFKHLSTVRRIIGEKHGTGGSSGVGFLKKALDISFFPELIHIRTLL
jgi:tryptophan 2,3-dioxygenase